VATSTNEITRYSETVEGDQGNYNWPARFDNTNGYIGITQSDNPNVNETSRVLLSPDQVKALIAFVKGN